MSGLLVKDGKFVVRSGSLVSANKPEDCDCCGGSDLCPGTSPVGVQCPDAPDAYVEYDVWSYSCRWGNWLKNDIFIVNCNPTGQGSTSGYCNPVPAPCQETGYFFGTRYNSCCFWGWSNQRMLKPTQDITLTSAWNGNPNVLYGCGSVPLTTPYVVSSDYWIYEFFFGGIYKGKFNPKGVSVFEQDAMLNWARYGCGTGSASQIAFNIWGSVVNGEYIPKPLDDSRRVYVVPRGCNFNPPEPDCSQNLRDTDEEDNPLP